MQEGATRMNCGDSELKKELTQDTGFERSARRLENAIGRLQEAISRVNEVFGPVLKSIPLGADDKVKSIETGCAYDAMVHHIEDKLDAATVDLHFLCERSAV